MASYLSVLLYILSYLFAEVACCRNICVWFVKWDFRVIIFQLSYKLNFFKTTPSEILNDSIRNKVLERVVFRLFYMLIFREQHWWEFEGYHTKWGFSNDIFWPLCELIILEQYWAEYRTHQCNLKFQKTWSFHLYTISNNNLLIDIQNVNQSHSF